MPIGTCVISGVSRRESWNACDGSSSAGSWTTTAPASPVCGLGLGDELHDARALAHEHLAIGLGADGDRLAGAQPHDAGLLLGAVLEHLERPVVEDRAVLVDLDERGAAVLGGRLEDAGELGPVALHRPRHEGRLGSQGQRHRVERGVDRAGRGRLGHLPDLRGGGVLALRQAVHMLSGCRMAVRFMLYRIAWIQCAAPMLQGSRRRRY